MLTSEVAYQYALDDLGIVDYRGFYSEKHIDLIYEFTPVEIKDEGLAWGSMLLNYWFSLAMVELNGQLGCRLMEEAGVTSKAIEHTIDRVRGINRHLRLVDTYTPIAPPTYKAEPLAWLNRGYDVATEARKGDVVVRKNVAALYVSSGWMSVSALGGFTYGKVEHNTLASCTLQVRRV